MVHTLRQNGQFKSHQRALRSAKNGRANSMIRHLNEFVEETRKKFPHDSTINRKAAFGFSELAKYLEINGNSCNEQDVIYANRLSQRYHTIDLG